ncbi:uracil-DNA glycosylase family protein [Youngiibacter multivorans]|uniref:Uracil-DNA glycosylase-like domain-containing protein n=1 Tax=Youngiibacter multivorans TaxID=937251 RepID=A0ABS4G778_9CLOT|nr:uracil-DNA glycosylase family protein [Youngiibacter multivorans]MBP1920418.1 hypothetical protein [Youngiibacter multivorans]
MNRYQLSQILFEQTKIIEPYPDKVKPVAEMVNVTAFFPGGKGLWLEDNSNIFPDILVLGHDFSTVDYYNKMLETGQSEINSSTWRAMRKLFNDTDSDLNRCFFSNVYMGLRDADKMTGVFPGSRDKEFVKRNLEFLKTQISTMNPKVIITLGKPASINLSLLSAQLIDEWSKGKALSNPNNGLKRNAIIDGLSYVCVALEHPSMRNQNVKRRRYENEFGVYTGNEAEIEMLKDALCKELTR